MNPESVSSRTFGLVKKGSGTRFPATVTHGPATMPVHLDPSRITTAVQDAAGNPLV